MNFIRPLIRAALFAAAAATQALAGYVGPDSVTYNYKIINWIHKDVYEESLNGVVNGVTRWTSNLIDNTTVAGVVILGPTGVVDFSASKQSATIESYSNFHYNTSASGSYREFTTYRPSATTYRERSYDSAGSPTVYAPSPTVSAGSLGVSYPTSITGGTVTSGTGYITVVSPEPDPIVGSPGYVDYQDASNYESYYITAGEQFWAMITWCDPVPDALTDPENPEWADEEFEEP